VNIEEIDKWLDNEYGVSYTELEKLHDFVVDRDREHQEQKDKTINDLLKRISNLEFEVEDLEKYKARCEKAREYIQSTYVTDNPIKFKNTLYEILIGSDKEWKN